MKFAPAKLFFSISRKAYNRCISIYNKFYYKRYISLPPHNHINSDGFVIVLQSGQYGGAPFLGIDIANQLVLLGYEVDIVFLNYGPLIKDNSKKHHIQVCTNISTAQKTISYLSKSGFHKIICNGALSGKYIHEFKSMNFEVIFLIHELTGVIKYFCLENAIKKYIEESDSVIFPSCRVKDEIESNYASNPKTIVIHQE